MKEELTKTKTPADPVFQLIQAINKGDLESAVAAYEKGAALVPEPGKVVVGTPAIREALSGFIALKSKLKAETYKVIQSDDLALYSSRWTLQGTAPDGSPVQMAGSDSVILRRQPSGDWLIAVDNPWGAAILS